MNIEPRRKSRYNKTINFLPSVVSTHNELLWALIGLLLTIGGTFVPVSFTNMPWNWSQQGIQLHQLNVSYQIGAVLLVGCLGGKNAAALSQIAYLVIGLTWLPVFSQGGGMEYLTKPSFGYLLGFVPGAWLCGWLAFQTRVRLESLAFSCLSGLFTIHLFGITYLLGLQIVNPISSGGILAFFQAIWKYSMYPVPGQVIVVCTVSLLAYLLRLIMFY